MIDYTQTDCHKGLISQGYEVRTIGADSVDAENARTVAYVKVVVVRYEQNNGEVEHDLINVGAAC